MTPVGLTLAHSRLLYTHEDVVHGIAWMDPWWISAGHDHCIASGTLAGGEPRRLSLVLRPSNVTVTPDYLVASSTYGPGAVIDRSLQRVVGALSHWDTSFHACCLGERLFTASHRGSIREWPARGAFAPPLARDPGLPAIVRSVGDGELWQVEIRRALNAFAVGPEAVWAAFSDGVGSWSLDDGAPSARRPTWVAPRNMYCSLALVGEHAVAGTGGRSAPALVSWRRDTRALEASVPLEGTVHRLRTGTTGSRALLVGVGPSQAWIRDPAHLEAPLVTVTWPGQFLEDCVLTPRGDLIIGGGNEVRVWDHRLIEEALRRAG